MLKHEPRIETDDLPAPHIARQDETKRMRTDLLIGEHAVEQLFGIGMEIERWQPERVEQLVLRLYEFERGAARRAAKRMPSATAAPWE